MNFHCFTSFDASCLGSIQDKLYGILRGFLDLILLIVGQIKGLIEKEIKRLMSINAQNNMEKKMKVQYHVLINYTKKQKKILKEILHLSEYNFSEPVEGHHGGLLIREDVTLSNLKTIVGNIKPVENVNTHARLLYVEE